MNLELGHLLSLTGTLVPGMDGRWSRDQGDRGDQDGPRYPARYRRMQIHALRDWWADRYPEAGAHYLAVRCWGLLIWQPIYLSVIAVHRSSIVPDLQYFRQQICDGFTAGYTLERHEPWRGDGASRWTWAAAQLRAYCNCIHAELQPVQRLSLRAAECIQADCVLHAVLCVQHRSAGADTNAAWARATAERWLEQLGIAGRSSYHDGAPLDDGPLKVVPQVCCHHFRRRDGSYCDNCPKRDAGLCPQPSDSHLRMA